MTRKVTTRSSNVDTMSDEHEDRQWMPPPPTAIPTIDSATGAPGAATDAATGSASPPSDCPPSAPPVLGRGDAVPALPPPTAPAQAPTLPAPGVPTPGMPAPMVPGPPSAAPFPPAAAPSLPAVPPPVPHTPGVPVPGTAPIVFDAALTFADEPAPRRRGRVATAGAVAGVLALGAAGVFAVTQMVGGNAGGADSPEGVGMAAMASIEQEDMLGLVDLLLPGERETFRDPMIEMVGELARIEVLSDDVALNDLSGIDVDLTDESTAVSPTNAPDIANITMRASMTATVNGAQLPVGGLITDSFGDDIAAVQETETTDFELPMTVVREDGRWYLSVLHTAAESIRGGDFGPPIPASGIVARGGDTPEGAIDVLLDGVERLELATILGAINPREAQALHRYAPLFLGDAQRALDEVPLRWQVTDVTYEVSGEGSTRFVDIPSGSIEGDFDGEEFSLAWSDGCAQVAAAGERFDSCELAEQADLDQFIDQSDSLRALVDEVTAAFADYEQPGIMVQEVGGQWYVSPIGTGLEQVLAVLRALDRAEVERIADRVEAVAADVAQILEGAFFPMFDTGSPFDDQFIDDPFVIEPPVDQPPITVPVLDDGTSQPGERPELSGELDDFELEQRIAGECYARDEVGEVVECLSGAVDAGDLPSYYISIELRHPECGTVEMALGRVALHQLTDAQYTDMMTTAATCFGALIDSGEVSEWDVPAEYLRPECAEGRNPWMLDAVDSAELFDRWIECVYS